jgi:hypothetical protein
MIVGYSFTCLYVYPPSQKIMGAHFLLFWDNPLTCVLYDRHIITHGKTNESIG